LKATAERQEMVFLLTPVCFVGGWLLVRTLAPGATGSGIPQVLASLNSKIEHTEPLDRLLSLPVLAIKILSSSVMALCGAVIGREGPSIQISAAVFYLIRQQWVRLGNKLALKNMMIAGGASGLAAAFNTPLGGIIYAVEELAKEHVSTFRMGLLQAVITAGLVAQLISGPYLFLGFPVIPEMQKGSALTVLLVALFCGLCGALFGRLLFLGLQWRLRMNFKQSFLFVVGLSLIFASIVYLVGPQSAGSGKNLIAGILFKDDQSSALVSIARVFWLPSVLSFRGSWRNLCSGPSLWRCAGRMDSLQPQPKHAKPWTHLRNGRLFNRRDQNPSNCICPDS
jgi:H+/Cl- antiporter ClcA